MDGDQQLKKNKRIALACLVAAAALFFWMAFLPPSFWVQMLKSGAEAAMVGGLADWFAVVALFRHPLGLPIPHTAIVPRSKDRIADSLSAFVKEKFLAPELLAGLIQRADLVRRGAKWLTKPANTQRVARYAGSLMSHGLALLGEERIRAFIKDAAAAAVGKIDLSRSLGAMFDLLTKDGRHQEMLDIVLDHVKELIAKPDIRDEIVSRFARWFKGEYPKIDVATPNSTVEWAGKKAASAIQAGLQGFVQEVADSPTHELRRKVDDALAKLIMHLREDKDFIRKGEEIKSAFLKNPAFHDYVTGLWGELRDWLMSDLNASQSQVRDSFSGIGLWIGERLMQDDELRTSLDHHLQSIAIERAPDFAQSLTGHIRATVKNWDAKQLSDQIEKGIGADLQFIRMSGTGVGFVIGIFIFLTSFAIRHF